MARDAGEQRLLVPELLPDEEEPLHRRAVVARALALVEDLVEGRERGVVEAEADERLAELVPRLVVRRGEGRIAQDLVEGDGGGVVGRPGAAASRPLAAPCQRRSPRRPCRGRCRGRRPRGPGVARARAPRRGSGASRARSSPAASSRAGSSRAAASSGGAAGAGGGAAGFLRFFGGAFLCFRAASPFAGAPERSMPSWARRRGRAEEDGEDREPTSTPAEAGASTARRRSRARAWLRGPVDSAAGRRRRGRAR